MKRIKTRAVVQAGKGIVNATKLPINAKNAVKRVNEKGEETQNTRYESPSEYATDHTQTTMQDGARSGVRQLKNAPKQISKNIKTAKAQLQEIKQQGPEARKQAATEARGTANTAEQNAAKLRHEAGQAKQTAQTSDLSAKDAKDTLRQVRHDGRQAVRDAKQGTSAQNPDIRQKPNEPNRVKPNNTAANHAKPSPGNAQTTNAPSNTTPTKAVPRKATPSNIKSPPKTTPSHGAKPLGNAPLRPTYTKAPPRAVPQKAAQAAGKSVKPARKTVKKTAKGTVKTVKKTVKTATQTAKVTVKTAQQTARAARQSAKAAVKTAKVAERTARAAAKAAVQTAKAAVKGVTAMVKAAIVAIKGLIAVIAAGGWVAVAIILIICLIGLIVASPLGIFFAGDARDGIPLSAAVAHINAELTTEMESRQNERIYDDIIHGGLADWVDVVAVYACKLAGAENDANDVTTFDAERIERLMEVMRDMSGITYDVETLVNPEADTQYILHINTSVLTADGAATRYGFTANQREALAELLDNRAELAALIGDLTISNSVALELLATLPGDLSPERAEAVRMALSLVGKVNYFWGGKSYVQGWDSAWGTMRRVTADGSSTTGTYRPFGLDCTGYLGWAFRNAGLSDSGTWHIGGNTVATTWANAQPGDIAVNADESHVGMVVGRDSVGNTLIAHCSYGANNVVITTAAEWDFVAVGVPPEYGG